VADEADPVAGRVHRAEGVSAGGFAFLTILGYKPRPMSRTPHHLSHHHPTLAGSAWDRLA
jgi:hypothetical protein